MKRTSFAIFGLLFLFARPVAAYVPLPPTPSDEQKNAWIEMGRQNELKYGRGGTSSAPTKVLAKPTSVPPSPTPTDTLVPTETQVPTALPTIPSVSSEVAASSEQGFAQILTGWINWWSIWRQEMARVTSAIRDMVRAEITIGPDPIPASVPTLTSTVQPLSPTVTPSPIPAVDKRAEELWNKGFDVWVQKKDYAAASTYYKQALAIDPNYAPALASEGYMLGAFYDKFLEGEAMIKKAMQLDSTWAYAPYNLGLLYVVHAYSASTNTRNIPMLQQGITWLQYAVDHFPNHPDHAWFVDHLRVAQEELKRWQQE